MDRSLLVIGSKHRATRSLRLRYAGGAGGAFGFGGLGIVDAVFTPVGAPFDGCGGAACGRGNRTAGGHRCAGHVERRGRCN
jgi:hypothetical protein